MKTRRKSKSAAAAEPKSLTPQELTDIRYKMLDGTWHSRACRAQTQILQLETLKEMLHLRIDDLDDGHAICLIQLVGNVLHDLRRELYGEDLGP